MFEAGKTVIKMYFGEINLTVVCARHRMLLRWSRPPAGTLARMVAARLGKGAVGGTLGPRRVLLRLWVWWAGKEHSLAALSLGSRGHKVPAWPLLVA